MVNFNNFQVYVDKVNKSGIFRAEEGAAIEDNKKPKLANHVLLNEYLPGQGIMAHLDGPMFHPTISTISLGSHAVIKFYREQAEDTEMTGALGMEERLVTSVLVRPRSLLVLKDEMYTKYLHGIEETHEDEITGNICNLTNCDIIGTKLPRTTRISLTIRHVPKTSKMKLKLGR